MSTEFNELLPLSHGDKTQILIIGYRDQVVHTINELCVLRFARDRALYAAGAVSLQSWEVSDHSGAVDCIERWGTECGWLVSCCTSGLTFIAANPRTIALCARMQYGYFLEDARSASSKK